MGLKRKIGRCHMPSEMNKYNPINLQLHGNLISFPAVTLQGIVLQMLVPICVCRI